MAVAVGHLDSDKHSAVTFLRKKSETSRSSVSPTNSSLVSTQKGFLGLGKKGKMKRTNLFTKQNKFLHGNNTRFKNSSSQRVSLKMSMEQLAKNIATFSQENLDPGVNTRNDNNFGGVSNPEHPDRSKRKLLWEGLKATSPN
ncbi:hypothetical protein EPI10_013224 [Gossypium australe]|uniref:Uncharacterized protein n=1 Tax=Gossypium australe TaxID=47621 RepID=A0A5B6UKS5_9ROSI|nr:hypothetical protein EPI10_013224 [Gossypium australe]